MSGLIRTSQICTSCGEEYRMDKMYFHRSRSPIYAANDNFITICKSCMAELYEKTFVELGGSKELALKKIAIIFDLPYSRDILAKTNDRKSKHIQQHITDCYFYVISKLPYVHQTFSDYKDQMNYIMGENNPIVGAKLNLSRKKLISVWGAGFTEEEYEYLQNRYDEWNCKVNIDSMSRESLVRDLCMIKLQQQKALSNEDIDVYNRLQKTYQDTLSTAHLKPIQEEVEQKSFEKPLGVMIEMFENEDPIPEPLPEWRDVDGIMKLFNVYFLGHLCKMLNIENRYSGMYEEEMRKYRAESEDLYDASDEDIFEHLVENGFPTIKQEPPKKVVEVEPKVEPKSDTNANTKTKEKKKPRIKDKSMLDIDDLYSD